MKQYHKLLIGLASLALVVCSCGGTNEQANQGEGETIELSADGPIKPPYAVYFQGGLTWPHARLGILRTVQNFLDRGLITL